MKFSFVILVLFNYTIVYGQFSENKTQLQESQLSNLEGASAYISATYVYKKVGEVCLSLHVYAPVTLSSHHRRPAMLFFHGGGWRTGSPLQFKEHCIHLAERGVVGITAEYRLSPKGKIRIGDCIEDAKSAMRWVRGNAEELGINPDRICSSGGSAGGYLASCTAIMDNFNANTDDLKICVKPNALVLFNPFLGLPPEQEKRKLLNYDIAEEEANLVNPLRYASNIQPPCLIFFGTKDNLLSGARLYQYKSFEAGNNCKIMTYEGQEHGFFNREKYIKLTLIEVDSFLDSLGWQQE